MALLGEAILGVWNDVDPAIEDDFNNWYLHEHIPERTSVPGMVRGRRYRAAEPGVPKFMAIYEALTMAVLTTGAYRDQLSNPTAWTQRVMPHFRFAQRGLCSVLGSLGQGVGGAAAVMHFRPRDGEADRLRGWLNDSALPSLMSQNQVSAAHAWAIEPGEPASPTSALSPRVTEARPVNWVVVAEAADAAAAGAARAHFLGLDPAAAGAADVVPYPVYQLLYVLDRRTPQP